MTYEFLPVPFDASTHYDTYASWWVDRKKTPPAIALLPKTGIVATLDGRLIAASFLYLANAGLAQIGFTAACPNSSTRKILQAVCYSMACLEKIAADNGVKAIHSFSDESGLTRIMATMGYRVLSKHDCLLKELGDEWVLKPQ